MQYTNKEKFEISIKWLGTHNYNIECYKDYFIVNKINNINNIYKKYYFTNEMEIVKFTGINFN